MFKLERIGKRDLAFSSIEDLVLHNMKVDKIILQVQYYFLGYEKVGAIKCLQFTFHEAIGFNENNEYDEDDDDIENNDGCKCLSVKHTFLITNKDMTEKCRSME